VTRHRILFDEAARAGLPRWGEWPHVPDDRDWPAFLEGPAGR
jgi:glutaredoxin-related protein